MSAYNLSTLLPAEMCREVQGWVDAMEHAAQFQRAMKSVRLLGAVFPYCVEDEYCECVCSRDCLIFTCLGRGVSVWRAKASGEVIAASDRGGHRKNYELFKTGRLDEREENFSDASVGYGDFWDADDEGQYCPPLCEFFDWERQ